MIFKDFFKRYDYDKLADDMNKKFLDEQEQTMAVAMKKSTITYSVGPGENGDGAMITFNNCGLITTFNMPAGHVNQFISLLRAVVPDDAENNG